MQVSYFQDVKALQWHIFIHVAKILLTTAIIQSNGIRPGSSRTIAVVFRVFWNYGPFQKHDYEGPQPTRTWFSQFRCLYSKRWCIQWMVLFETHSTLPQGKSCIEWNVVFQFIHLEFLIRCLMITQILNSFCNLSDVYGATFYQMQNSDDTFKSVQANNT